MSRKENVSRGCTVYDRNFDIFIGRAALND
jgi:hypothetical protein